MILLGLFFIAVAIVLHLIGLRPDVEFWCMVGAIICALLGGWAPLAWNPFHRP